MTTGQCEVCNIDRDKIMTLLSLETIYQTSSISQSLKIGSSNAMTKGLNLYTFSMIEFD